MSITPHTFWTAQDFNALAAELLAGGLFFDVKKTYGADGNGGDASTAFTNALADASAAGGGIVHFDRGSYVLAAASTFQVPANTIVQGAGWGSILTITATGAAGNILLNGTGAGLRNLTIRRGNATATRCVALNTSNTFLDQVQFDGQTYAFNGFAVTIAGGDHIWVNNCWWNQWSGTGITMGGTNLEISNSTFTAHRKGGGTACISSNQGGSGTTDGLRIINNDIETDTTDPVAAISIGTSGAGATNTNGMVSNNRIKQDGTNFGVTVQKFGGGTINPANWTVSDNVFTMLSSGGTGSISMAGVTGCTVSNNQSDATQSTYTGIEIARCDTFAVVGNVISGGTSAGQGIIVLGSSNGTVSGNTINGFSNTAQGSCGIAVQATTSNLTTQDVTLTGNTIVMPAAGSATQQYGFAVTTNNASASLARINIVGNTVRGNLAGTARGCQVTQNGTAPVLFDSIKFSDNIVTNVNTIIVRSGDTNPLGDGSFTTAIARTTIAVTSSPQTYQNLDGYPEIIIVSGGTVSLMQYSRDNSTFDTYATVTGAAIRLEAGDYVKLTYSSNPTIAKFPAR